MTKQRNLSIDEAKEQIRLLHFREISGIARIGITTAGTADTPAAGEVRVAAEEMGCDVDLIYDAGAAGIHRLFPDLSKLIEIGVDAIVVAAGRGGTRPTVVSGLVPVLVVGLPVSVDTALAARANAPLDAPVMFCTCRSSTSMLVLWQACL